MILFSQSKVEFILRANFLNGFLATNPFMVDPLGRNRFLKYSKIALAKHMVACSSHPSGTGQNAAFVSTSEYLAHLPTRKTSPSAYNSKIQVNITAPASEPPAPIEGNSTVYVLAGKLLTTVTLSSPSSIDFEPNGTIYYLDTDFSRDTDLGIRRIDHDQPLSVDNE
jgi:hypothetical protein